MPAFEHAVELGYRYLETDVHVTADGVLLAFHDDRLDRVTDRTGVIAELPWAEVQQARVDGASPSRCSRTCSTAWPDVRVNIDPKHDAVVEPLAAALAPHGAVDRVCVGVVLRHAHRPGAGARRARASARRMGPRRGRPARVGVTGPPGRRRIAVAVRPGAHPPRAPPARHRALRGRRPPPGRAGPRVDDRRPDRDDAPARPRRRRDHDRPPAGAEGCSLVDRGDLAADGAAAHPARPARPGPGGSSPTGSG